MSVNYAERQYVHNYLSSPANLNKWYSVEDISNQIKLSREIVYYYLESILKSPGGSQVIEKRQLGISKHNEYRAIQ